MNWSWKVQLWHISRIQNVVADKFAALSRDKDMGEIVWVNPHEETLHPRSKPLCPIALQASQQPPSHCLYDRVPFVPPTLCTPLPGESRISLDCVVTRLDHDRAHGTPCLDVDGNLPSTSSH
ncbi:hypothetical protein V6N12_003267 [Hibiscus sabdariffa]|uniref:RNase H type-1 domain-containing protein n=1 Tax=Hibiscus sabdariffa TaxID=183260 RepID=A0ABR2EBC6_9ROSI